ncbi:hypothetical protein BKA83DRAFT_4126687 [Pisolithus microcarpus]|nr:hypothetical protein BKA83DRAFT_4126687 [Pisolithus microcarpus]
MAKWLLSVVALCWMVGQSGLAFPITESANEDSVTQPLVACGDKVYLSLAEHVEAGNVGFICEGPEQVLCLPLALVAKSKPNYGEAEASKEQAMQVFVIGTLNTSSQLLSWGLHMYKFMIETGSANGIGQQATSGEGQTMMQEANASANLKLT